MQETQCWRGQSSPKRDVPTTQRFVSARTRVATTRARLFRSIIGEMFGRIQRSFPRRDTKGHPQSRSCHGLSRTITFSLPDLLPGAKVGSGVRAPHARLPHWAPQDQRAHGRCRWSFGCRRKEDRSSVSGSFGEANFDGLPVAISGQVPALGCGDPPRSFVCPRELCFQRWLRGDL